MEPGQDVALRNLSGGISARLSEMNRNLSSLEESIRLCDIQTELVVKEIAGLNLEASLFLKEADLLVAHNESLSDQITLLTEVVRPQLLNQLKQNKERAEAKEKEYREVIQRHEKLWQRYEEAYNKFPRVAERNAGLIKLKLIRIKAMKKKQEMIEKRKQADQLEEIKARRLEILKTEVLECLSTQHDTRLNCEELEKEIIEIQTRISAKKAKKLEEQKQLEEERKKQLEDELQRQASQDALVPDSTCDEATAMAQQPSLSQPLVFKIPNFEMPTMAYTDVTPTLPPPRVLKSLTGSPLLSRIAACLGFRKTNGQGLHHSGTSLGQPVKRTASVLSEASDPNLPVTETPPLMHSESLHFQEGACQVARIQEVSNETDVNPGMMKRTKLSNYSIPPRGFKEANSAFSNSPSSESFPLSSGSSKREFILSTDNIAAKLKETMRPNVEAVHIDKRNTTKVSIVEHVIPSSQENLISQECTIAGQDSNSDSFSMELMETDPCRESAHPAHPESNNNNLNVPEDSITSQHSSDLSQSHSAENVRSPSEGDNAYDFAAEYGEEMYPSLQSPPSFEPVMSPEHAGFDTSPVLIGDRKDTSPADVGQMPSFGGFGFFTQASTSIFGRPSDSNTANEKDKSVSSFSFLF